MNYNFGFSPSVYDDLLDIPKDKISGVLRSIFNKLQRTFLKNPIMDGEFKGLRKFRSGKYRVVYFVFVPYVIIYRVGHRKEIYE